VADTRDRLPDWERLLAAERHLQRLVPDSVLVGRTAAALHADHRVSIERLAAAMPSDLATIDLRSYKNLREPWTDWAHVTARGRDWARRLASLALTER